MHMKNIAIVILLLFVALPSIGRARERPTATYTKDQIDARISELRSLYNSQFVPRSEIEGKLNALQSDMKQLIDRNELIDQQRGQEIVQSEKDLERSTKAPNYWPIIGSVLGALTSAAIGAWVVRLVAKHFTWRLKMIESTLEFSKRFGELIKEQSNLNQAYAKARTTQTQISPPTNLETDEALVWWWRFYNLVLYEYDFFRQGLVWDERFIQWMKWRWYEFNAQGKDIWKTNGMDYREGWKAWKERPANKNNRLIIFLDRVHAAKDVNEVVDIVRESSPKWWHHYHLEG
jgi:hypothetical protein